MKDSEKLKCFILLQTISKEEFKPYKLNGGMVILLPSKDNTIGEIEIFHNLLLT